MPEIPDLDVVKDFLNERIAGKTIDRAEGLRIEYLHEHPGCAWQRFSAMERGADGWRRLPPPHDGIPLTFSLRAAK